MLVYRVEDEYGHGPYTGRHNFDYEYGPDISRHPTPDRDGFNFKFVTSDKFKSYIFGFKSLEQLKKWFNEDERLFLLDYGYHVAVYEVMHWHVAHGNRQVAFSDSQSKKIGTISFEEDILCNIA